MAAFMPVKTPNTPQYAPVNASASGANDIVAAVAGYFIVLDAYMLVPASAVTVTWEGSTSGALSGAMPIGGTTAPLALFAEYREGLLTTASNEQLVLNLSSAVSVQGHVTFHLVPDA